CCTSVLTETNSTWLMPASIIRLTAFSPAPPTPTTWIFARYEPSVPAPAGAASGPVASRSCCRCAASVALKSSASGPSRMLARLRAIEHLLREIAVEGGGVAGRLVAQDRLTLHGRLGVAHGLADLCVEDEITKVLFQNVHRFARVQEALVIHRREDSLDLDVRVQ